jgi:hypothetical protein
MEGNFHCRACLPMVMHTCHYPHGHCLIESICIPWPWCIYHFQFSTWQSHRLFSISHFPRQFTNLNARDPRAENTIGAQIDHLHAYLTCHVEILEKGRVVSINQLSNSHECGFIDKRGKKRVTKADLSINVAKRGSLHGMLLK